MAGEPGGLQRARRHAASHQDLECALAQRDLGRAIGFQRRVEQAVEAITAPIQLFLQGDHPAADALRPGSGLIEPLSQGQVHRASQAASRV
jgi:hypothetical protein